jgi:hypothetical protein
MEQHLVKKDPGPIVPSLWVVPYVLIEHRLKLIGFHFQQAILNFLHGGFGSAEKRG